MKAYLPILLCAALLLLVGCAAAPAKPSEPTEAPTEEMPVEEPSEKPSEEPALEGEYAPLTWKYDDRIPVEQLGHSGAPKIETIEVTSKSVAGEPDTDVVVWQDGTLYAVGIGRAKLTFEDWAEPYLVTVEPAALSIILMTGHSLGAGEQGSAREAVRFPAGLGYSSYEGNGERCLSFADMTKPLGLGCFADSRPFCIDDAAVSGVTGELGAIAYEWNVLTGEKAWVLDAARGGSTIDQWLPGKDLYIHAVDLYRRAAQITAAEIAAGHYTLSHILMLEYNCANGEEYWDPMDYYDVFTMLRKGFLEDLAYDFGDGQLRTVEAIGVCPTWYIGTEFDPTQYDNFVYAFNNAKRVNFGLAASAECPELFIANLYPKMWMTEEGIAQYFAERFPVYETANGPQTYVPTGFRDLYADGVHYTQLAYNAAGIESAKSLYDFLFGEASADGLILLEQNGLTEVGDSVTVSGGMPTVIVPVCTPATARELTVELPAGLFFRNSALTGSAKGTVTFRVSGSPVRSVSVN